MTVKALSVTGQEDISKFDFGLFGEPLKYSFTVGVDDGKGCGSSNSCGGSGKGCCKVSGMNLDEDSEYYVLYETNGEVQVIQGRLDSRNPAEIAGRFGFLS